MLHVLLLVPLLAVYGNAFQLPLGYKYSQKFQSLRSGETATSPLDKSFDKFVHETLSKWHVPGVAVAVIKDGVTYSKGYGIATFPDEKVTPETLFFAGGTTKAHTAAAVSLLVDDDEEFKNVQWSTPLSDLIPDDFVLTHNATRTVTVEDALSHRSGMPAREYFQGIDNSTARGVVRSLRHLSMSAPIRTTSQYGNLMYVAVAHALEVVTGVALGDYLRTRIWEPLGMKDTFFSLEDAQQAQLQGKVKLAHGYIWDEQDGFRKLPYVASPELDGAVGVISNVIDYAKWIGMMMNSTLPLSKKGHKALTSPRSIAGDYPYDIYGRTPMPGSATSSLGWFNHHYHGEELNYHFGINSRCGFGAVVGYMPRRNFGFVVMGNGAHRGSDLATRLIEDFLETPKANRYDWSEKSSMVAQRYKDHYENTVQNAHAQHLKKSMPHSLPLSSYTGTYHHPAYQNVTVILCNGTLVADFRNRTSSLKMTLTHLFGESFLVQEQLVASSQPGRVSVGEFGVKHFPQASPEKGMALSLNIVLEKALGNRAIPFRRVSGWDEGAYC